MRFEDNRPTTFPKEFGQAIAMINPIAVVQFFEAVYTGIFKHLLTIKSIKNGFLELVLMYFGIVEINSPEIIQLYYLI